MTFGSVHRWPFGLRPAASSSSRGRFPSTAESGDRGAGASVGAPGPGSPLQRAPPVPRGPQLCPRPSSRPCRAQQAPAPATSQQGQVGERAREGEPPRSLGQRGCDQQDRVPSCPKDKVCGVTKETGHKRTRGSGLLRETSHPPTEAVARSRHQLLSCRSRAVVRVSCFLFRLHSSRENVLEGCDWWLLLTFEGRCVGRVT